MSSMFASAEEVPHIYFIIIIVFSSGILACPLRVVTVKIPKVFTVMTKQKNPFLTSKSSNAYAKEKCFVSRANAASH